jgi:hypothetical protein
MVEKSHFIVIFIDIINEHHPLMLFIYRNTASKWNTNATRKIVRVLVYPISMYYIIYSLLVVFMIHWLSIIFSIIIKLVKIKLIIHIQFLKQTVHTDRSMVHKRSVETNQKYLVNEFHRTYYFYVQYEQQYSILKLFKNMNKWYILDA